jgi:hypothetical protein
MATTGNIHLLPDYPEPWRSTITRFLEHFHHPENHETASPAEASGLTPKTDGR